MRGKKRDNEPSFPPKRAVQRGTRACLTSAFEMRAGGTRQLWSSQKAHFKDVYKHCAGAVHNGPKLLLNRLNSPGIGNASAQPILLNICSKEGFPAAFFSTDLPI